jgi:CheY-like chemotaxis protein
MPGLDGIGFARALRAEGLQGDMKLMLLSSLGAPDDARIAQDNGFSRFIPKPVRKAELRQAILGLAAPGSEPEAVRIRFDCHVLVIEDNAVNQEVMQQMLKRLGCHVSMAATAMDGLRALTERRFDLVLMDIQMPGMDGVEALQWLRGRRGERFDFMTPPDVPVVAVTANALDGDEERFLDLGFDDYVSKPFRQSRLVVLLNRFLSDIAHERSGLTAPAPFDDEIMVPVQGRFARTTSQGEEPVNSPMSLQFDRSSPLDPESLDKLRELDPSGANHLMERVLKAYDSSVSRLVPQLEESAGRGDLDGVRHVVHTLKSSSASIGAKQLSLMCAETEQAIRENRALADLPGRVSALRREIECVQRELHRLLEPQRAGDTAPPPA